MTTREASQVGAFSLGNGRFDMLNREGRVHLRHSLVVDRRGRQERRIRALRVAGSSALSGCVAAAPSLTL